MKKHWKESLSQEMERRKRSRSRSVSPNHTVKKHQKESLSPERRRLRRGHSRSVQSPLGHCGGERREAKSPQRPSQKARSRSPEHLGNTRSEESAYVGKKSSRGDSTVKRSRSRSPKNLGNTSYKESAHVVTNSSMDNSSFKECASRSVKSGDDCTKTYSHLSFDMKQNFSQKNSSINTHKSRSRSRSPESLRINRCPSPEFVVRDSVEQNYPLHDTSLGTIATSSSVDEQVLKENFCTDSLGENSTLLSCPFECGSEERSLSDLKHHIQLNHAEKSSKGETPHSDSNTTSRNLLCPFECTVEPFKTKNDQKEHLVKAHSCTDMKQSTPVTGSSSTNDPPYSKDINGIDQKISQENNNIRKTFLSNPHGLSLYKFRRLIRDNDLHEVSVRGNGYCFISCIIITLAEYGINKTLEVLSTEVMAHIRQHKEEFYSGFQGVSKSGNKDEVENLIECCARYFQDAAYFTDSVDVCIGAIAKTLGVNLNVLQKDQTTKLVTLTRFDCNQYDSTVNLFLHYYPGSKHGKYLDAHYNCYVNSQYHKQNAAAISSRMVKTVEEEEADKKALALKINKGNTAVTSARNVKLKTVSQKEVADEASNQQSNGKTSARSSTVNPVTEPEEEAKNLSPESPAASSVTRKLRSSTQVPKAEKS